MKKFLSVLLSITMLLTITAGLDLSAYADDFSSATALSVNQSISGNTLKGYDYEQDYYKVTVPANGSLTINFSNPLQKDSGQYWSIYLYDSSYEELCSASIYGNSTSTSLPSIGVVASATYYIKVNGAGWRDASSTDTYTITANYSQSEFWEKEFNENYTDATAISLNTSYNGTTRKGYDYEQDYYKVTVPANGVLTINFSNPLQKDSEHYWSVYLYDSSYEELCSASIYGNSTSTSLASIGAVASTTYYIKVDGAGWRDASSTDTYTITANFSQSEYWEKEFNEDYTSANAISLNTTYYGTTRKGYDYEKDFYVINITSRDTYVINFNTPNLKNSDTFWTVYLYDSSYTELYSMDIKGNLTSNSIKAVLSSGTYYIKVNSTSWRDASSTEVYSFYISRYVASTSSSSSSSTPKKTSVKKVTSSKKKQIKVTWKKKSGVTGYQVQYATNKKFTKNKKTVTVKGASKTSKTIKKLKSKKTYYVRVRTYKTVNGKKVYSNWSTVKKIKTK